ncbi:MAG: ACP S-malonyltransferase [Ignavibacteriales bacterium]|nr:ACP S-malonyltransferase [Ignavibacteriales bacterium]
MLKIAYIFPGQGSQYVGMGKDLFEKNESAKAIFKTADKILGIGLSDICFEGPEEVLRQTMNTQPAIFLHSMVLFHLIGNQNISMVAGHSLGEYSALVAAGSLSFEDGLRLVRLRGELMQKAGIENKGTMAAIVGLEPDTVANICTHASVAGIVQCANFNSPGQIVISGSIGGVQKAVELSKENGAKMAKELVVSGAFHSPLMQSAREGLMAALQETNIEDAQIPVYTNVTAQPVRSSVEIRKMLGEQLTSAVRWQESISNMIKDGAEKFIEIGPGKVLQGLVKRIAPNIDVKGVDKLDDIGKE